MNPSETRCPFVRREKDVWKKVTTLISTSTHDRILASQFLMNLCIFPLFPLNFYGMTISSIKFHFHPINGAKIARWRYCSIFFWMVVFKAKNVYGRRMEIGKRKKEGRRRMETQWWAAKTEIDQNNISFPWVVFGYVSMTTRSLPPSNFSSRYTSHDSSSLSFSLLITVPETTRTHLTSSTERKDCASCLLHHP